MIIFWHGRGWLVFVAIIVSLFFSVLFLDGTSLDFQDGTWQNGLLQSIIVIATFLPIWICGKRWNSQGTAHDAYWIPMQYWAIIWPLLIILINALQVLK